MGCLKLGAALTGGSFIVELINEFTSNLSIVGYGDSCGRRMANVGTKYTIYRRLVSDWKVYRWETKNSPSPNTGALVMGEY